MNTRSRRHARGRGFTLAELLIVIVIIAVLASMVLPRFMGQLERSQAAEAVNIMSAIRRALLAYNDEHKGQADEWRQVSGNETVFSSELGISFTPPQYWAFSTVPSADSTTYCIRADNPGGVLWLDAKSGEWSGSGNYTTTTGKYWPDLQPAASAPCETSS